MNPARVGIVLLAAVATMVPAKAEALTEGANAFFFAGRFHNEWVWETAAFWRDHYEDNYFIGAGYQNFLLELPANFHVGVELGAGLRLGAVSSTELWGGVVLKNEGFSVGGFTVAPAATAGISVVSDTIGVETERAGFTGEDVSTLFYLGPEIAVSHEAMPGMEFFTRIQHRSGGYGVLAHIDGSNAATLGIRFKL